MFRFHANLPGVYVADANDWHFSTSDLRSSWMISKLHPGNWMEFEAKDCEQYDCLIANALMQILSIYIYRNL